MSNKRLYNIWSCMKQRCFNPKHTAARWYHDKGIRVCEEWLSFDKFQRWALDNGYSDNLTIDRIDSEGNYEPGNCRWISLQENAKRISRSTAKGKRKSRIEGCYEIVCRVPMLFEVVVERGYSYSFAIRRVSELEENNKTLQVNIAFSNSCFFL